mgnify:CR=1 FL=1
MALIDLKDIYKIYQMGSAQINAIDGLDCQIEKGEYVALMGPSGSGKSTLMNIIGCLDTPSEGVYSLNGTNVSDMSDDDLASIRNVEIGFVFQSFNLIDSATTLLNVEVPLIYSGVSKSDRTKRAREALLRVGLGDRLAHYPSQLSGGQKQRVAIARALINNPKVLLADEPTGALDSKTSKEVMDLIQKINKAGKTILVVTHEQDIAEMCSRIVKLKDGVIVEDKKIRQKKAL